ncbi:LysR family transcriptional regulator [Psychromonas ossibalaenae]|uniref:LysR family transcriptional regulator n=1 Tax=Psychromonas ossibalaenae TaxID=444922 RepID=UPI00036443E5|nr:LysR family transcriptional regulator [Psychromonas ossibalaenae]
MLNSKNLHYFVSVVEHGSYTKAAASLNIAQSALSISMSKFEQKLGVTLLYRSRKGVSVTKEGQVLLSHAKIILNKMADAQTAVDELRGLEKGEVKIGIPSMMGTYFFPEILMAFKFQHPHLNLSIVESGTQTIKDLLLSGELDLGIIINENVPDELQAKHLITSQMVAAVGQNHPLAVRKQIDCQTFFDHELVMFKAGYFHRAVIDELCQRHHCTAQYSFETNLLAMILNIVKNEFAITALLELVTDVEPDIQGIPFVPAVHLDLAMAWRRDGYLSVANKRFVDFTLNAVNKNSQFSD